MARFGAGFLRVAKDTMRGWVADNCPSRAAALAYYTAFSVAPILVIATAVASFFFQHEAVVSALLEQSSRLVGPEGSSLIGRLLTAAAEEKNRGVAAIVGAVALLLGATTAFAELKDSLDAIWRAPKDKANGFRALLRARLLSFGLVLSIAFLLLVSLIANAALDAFSGVVSERVGFGVTMAARVIAIVTSVVGVAVLFALIFKLLPAIRPTWKTAWKGAAFTTVLFFVGRAGIGLYLGNTATASSFGAAGSLAILLLWVYYSALIFFVGAEFTRIESGVSVDAPECERGLPVGPSSPPSREPGFTLRRPSHKKQFPVT